MTKRIISAAVSTLVAFTLALPLTLAPASVKADNHAFQIDGAHTTVSFKVRHLGVSSVRGQFNDVSGSITYDESDPLKSTVEVTIDATSIDTDNEDRDNHLRSEDFLKVAEFPQITFKSKKVEKKGDGLVVTGDLTIRGATKEVQIPFELVGPIKDPWGMTRVGIEGELTIDRRDWGLTWNKAMEAGGFVVGHDVKIDLLAEAVKK